MELYSIEKRLIAMRKVVLVHLRRQMSDRSSLKTRAKSYRPRTGIGRAQRMRKQR